MVAVPAATPSITPVDGLTVATPVVLELQVPAPPVAVQVVVLPLHIEVEPPEITGVLLVTVIVFVLAQEPVVPVNVYVVVADGDAFTVAPVLASRPVAGSHE